MTNVELHDKICKTLRDTYISKNEDYGDSTHKSYRDYGMISFVVRMQDKLNRIYNLTCKNSDRKVENEKVEDTLLDLANYAILALIELGEDKTTDFAPDFKIEEDKNGKSRKNRHV